MMSNNNEYQKAKDYALRSLTFREQTEKQLRDKMKIKEYSEDIIDMVIDFLKEYKYLDDERFLEQYIFSHKDKMNRKKLSDKLYSFGFKNIRIDDYLDESYNEELILKREMDKYVRSKDVDDPIVKKKIMSHFLSKGYEYSLIKAVFKMYNIDEEY